MPELRRSRASSPVSAPRRKAILECGSLLPLWPRQEQKPAKTGGGVVRPVRRCQSGGKPPHSKIAPSRCLGRKIGTIPGARVGFRWCAMPNCARAWPRAGAPGRSAGRSDVCQHGSRMPELHQPRASSSVGPPRRRAILECGSLLPLWPRHEQKPAKTGGGVVRPVRRGQSGGKPPHSKIA